MARPEVSKDGNLLQESMHERIKFSEEERYRIVVLRELNLDSEQDLNIYFRLLTHPENIEHFSNPPTDAENLKQKLVHDSTHAYLAENMLGEVVGGGGINDAEEGQHDHFLVKVVVDPDLQGRGVGRQLVIQLIDKAFATNTNDGRERLKLDAAVIQEIGGAERMGGLLESLGFQFRSRLPQQVDVVLQATGETVRKPTHRWELMRDDWRRRREMPQGHNNSH